MAFEAVSCIVIGIERGSGGFRPPVVETERIIGADGP